MANIYQLPTPIPMTSSVFPQLKFAVFGDTLDEIKTPGYLDSSQLSGGSPLSPGDVLMTLYDFSSQASSGGFAIFTVSINGATNQITLVEWINPSQITLPLVNNNLIKAMGTNGVLADSGINISNVMQTNISNTMSASGKITLAKVNATESPPTVVTANGTCGQITTVPLTTPGGSSYAITWINSNITPNSVFALTLQGGTLSSTGDIQFVILPTNGQALLNILNNSGSAFNGTLIIGYTIF